MTEQYGRRQIKYLFTPGVYELQKKWGRDISWDEQERILDNVADAYEARGLDEARKVMKSWEGADAVSNAMGKVR